MTIFAFHGAAHLGQRRTAGPSLGPHAVFPARNLRRNPAPLADTTLVSAPLHQPELDADHAPTAHAEAVTPTAFVLERAAATGKRAGALLDPGWLFLFAGIVLLSAVLILPAQEDLDEAKLFLARVHAAEQHRADRLERYQKYHAAVERGEPQVLLSLAASQLNQAPQGQELLVPGDAGAAHARDASVFDALEPPPLAMPQRATEPSMLQKWASEPRSRLVLIGAAALCLLIGLLPPTKAR